MKTILRILILAFLFPVYITAQTGKENSKYLFEKFQNSYIFYKDGRVFSVPLNFDLVKGIYVFIDNDNKEENEFSDPDQVLAMHVGERIFLMSRGRATEVIQAEPKFHVLYTALKKKAPSKISYGGTSETASVDSYTRLGGKGLISGIQSDNRIVADVSKSYEARIGKRDRSFYNQRSFVRLFPKEKRVAIDTYIEEKEVDFNSTEQVLELYQYATEL
ncbi:MAG: hypothetical protein PHQ67_11445 [Fermentimonas sp.]|nr:hypothetical protein [Fermentimonas sp.]MDD4010398.1 hypothetical protein [Fermentimonas sp.]